MTHTHGIIAVALVAVLGCAQAADAAWRNSLKPAGTPGRGLVLAAGGETEYVIVIPAKPTTQERKAADDLALWLREMSSAKFRIVPDSEPAIETELSIGRTKRLGKAYTPAARLGDEFIVSEKPLSAQPGTMPAATEVPAQLPVAEPVAPFGAPAADVTSGQAPPAAPAGGVPAAAGPPAPPAPAPAPPPEPEEPDPLAEILGHPTKKL